MKALLKALDNNPNGALYYALLRERILHIMDATLADMENNPDAWKNTFYHPDLYKRLDEIVCEHLSFND
jgi:hypothetical protein